jgi:transcriptional regulator with XRE-family HTH domain
MRLMPARAPSMSKTAAGKLAALGAQLRAHRTALKLTATTVAEAAGLSRVTLHRIERGEPSVTIGAYLSVLAALGLELEVIDVVAPRKKRGPAVPKHVRVADYAQLKRLAWQLGDVAVLTPRAALALYERNWKHVDTAAMDDTERALIRTLVDGLGGGRLLV